MPTNQPFRKIVEEWNSEFNLENEGQGHPWLLKDVIIMQTCIRLEFEYDFKKNLLSRFT